MQKLSYSGFEWDYDVIEYLSGDEIANKFLAYIEKLNKNGHGAFFEVDLIYLKHLHDLHNDFPLAPENMKVGKVTKLIPNLNDKVNYRCHYRMLLYYLEKGMILTKVHKVLK